MSETKPILYAEDDENDIFLMERAFSKLQIPNVLRTVTDGKTAIAYLAGTPPYQDRLAHPLPALMMMDLSMPGKHGLEVLKWMKDQPVLASIPVIVLSSSNQEKDIQAAYQLGAKGFLIKPGHPEQLLRVVKAIQDFWLSGNQPSGTFIDFAAAANARPPTVPGV